MKEAAKVEIISFAVSEEEVAPGGGSIQVSWETKNADSVRLTANAAEVDLGGAAPGEGSVSLEIVERTEFRLIAAGKGGQAESDVLIVRIGDLEPLEIVSFTVSPDAVEDGEEITLSWRTKNAEKVQISDAAGEAVSVEGQDAAEGSVQWLPTVSTTYTLVAERGNESMDATASLTVRGAPTAALGATASRIGWGEAVTISWRTEEATSIRIEKNGELFHQTTDAEGEIPDTPDLSATYVLTAEREARRAVESISVEVEPKILAFARADEAPAPVGAMVRLAYEVGGATEITLANGGSFEETFPVEARDEGILEAPMGEDGAFTLRARSGELVATAEVEQPVLAPPSIGGLVSAEFVSAEPGEEGSVVVSWFGIQRATGLLLVADTLGPIDLMGQAFSAGQVTVSISEDTQFTLTANNGAGEAMASASTRVVPFPRADLLAAAPKRVGSMEAFELSWATTNSTSISLTANGSPVAGVNDDQLDGSISLQIPADTTYTLRAYNDAMDFVEETLTVSVGAPQNLSFDVEPSYAPVGGTLTFTWTNLGGTSLELLDRDGTPICTTSNLLEIEEGTCIALVTSEGTHEFSLSVTNAVGGIGSASASVVANAGPMLISFSGTPDNLTIGQSITFSWEVMNDPFGESPMLTLTDGTKSYDLSDANPNQGSKAFVFGPSDHGAYEFTFTASTAAGNKTATFEAIVHGFPYANLSASPEVYDGSGPVTLSWTSQHATAALHLYETDATGNLIQPPLLTVPEGERAAGSFDVHPTRDTTYEMTAENGAGMVAFAWASVTLAPPEVLTFVAVPDEVVAGDEVELSWTTKMATGVSLSVVDGMVVHELGDSTYFDLSVNGGTPLVLTSTCGTYLPWDEGCADLIFPQGFSFPFGGINQTVARVLANGAVGFNTSFTDDSHANQDLPSTSPFAGNVHLAPFWDDLDIVTGMYYLFGSDARGQFLAIQWSDLQFVSGTSNLNFQVIMWADGGFDFRYGTMTSSLSGRAAGSSATIGYQTPSRDEFHTIHFGASGTGTGSSISGGLSNRGWAFRRPIIEPNGSYSFTPNATTDVILTATGPGGTSTDSVPITVYPRASLTVTQPTKEIDAGETFEISWASLNNSAVEIFDADGLRCSAGPEELAFGSCTLSEAVAGTYTYTVRAIGALAHVVEKEIELQIFIPLSLDHFQVSTDEIAYGGSVTLDWQTTGASTVTLTANDVDILPGGASPALGSTTHSPQVETVYVFTMETADGRTKTKSYTVKVRTFEFSLDATAMDVAPGSPVTISWELLSLNGNTPSVTSNWPMVEVSTSFEDISQLGQTSIIGSGKDNELGTVQFPTEFSFPYFQEEKTAIRLSEDGWISFDTSASLAATNQSIPTSSASHRKMHLPIFWDDLYTQNGRVDAVHLPNPSRFIVQWTNVGRYYPSSTRGYDLNFQVVLFPDGSFEYRYGTMDAPLSPATSLSDCNPLNCANETNGSSATIGYQDPTGTVGQQLHYGGPSSLGHPPFPNGPLANRSFRYAEPPAKSFTVSPSDTTDYEICAELDGFAECKTVTVRADWEIVSFDSDASRVDAGQVVELSWTTINAESLTLTANGIDIPIAEPFGSGSALHVPLEKTTYVLTLTSLGRTKTETVIIEVRTVDLQLMAPASAFAGDSVIITWSAGAFGGGTPTVYGPMSEISASFVDISSDPGAVQLIGAAADTTISNHSFAANFEFPFAGENRTSLRVATDGYLSFDTSTSTVSANTILPNSGSTQKRIHLAPFWDNLHTRSSGRVQALATAAGSYIIQWSHISKTDGSTNTNEYDLNFQVELFSDGSFEYRYGTMDPPATTSSSCHPTNDCVGDANGASATIGYQETAGVMGQIIHFGGGGQASANQPIAGGLSDRSFRFDPSATSATFHASRTTTISVCVELRGYLECQDVTIFVPTAGEVIITEFLPSPMAGGSQWLEVRNLLPVDIDLEGWTLNTQTATHTIGSSLLIPQGQYVTLSASSTPGFIADYVYGQTLPVDPVEDTLSLKAGSATVSEVSWNASWNIGTGQSLELDPIRQRLGISTRDQAGHFCLPSTLYDGANSGTPGQHGRSCSISHYTVDPYAVRGGVDISAIEGPVPGLTGYDAWGSVVLGFDFPFYGDVHDEMFVSAHGYLSFDTLASALWTNQQLPSTSYPANQGIISGFWDDLSFSRRNAYVRWAEVEVSGVQAAIFRWYDVGPFSGSSGDYLSLQIELWENGEIVFRYFNQSGTALSMGSSATIGLQAPVNGASDFALYSHNQASVSEGQVIVFTPVP